MRTPEQKILEETLKSKYNIDRYKIDLSDAELRKLDEDGSLQYAGSESDMAAQDESFLAQDSQQPIVMTKAQLDTVLEAAERLKEEVRAVYRQNGLDPDHHHAQDQLLELVHNKGHNNKLDLYTPAFRKQEAPRSMAQVSSAQRTALDDYLSRGGNNSI